METRPYISVLAIAGTRQFGQALRQACQDRAGLDVVSVATNREQAVLNAGHCSAVLFDAKTLDHHEIGALIRLLRLEYAEICPIIVHMPYSAEWIVRHIEAGAAGFHFDDQPLAMLAERVRRIYTGLPVLPPKAAAQLLQRLSELIDLQQQVDCEERILLHSVALSHREEEVLHLLGNGLTNRQIADRLVIQQGTVKNHVHRILKKLDVKNREEAASLYQLIKQ